MKKVATISFGYSQNLGALLQAYALQRYIKSLGYQTEMIQFRPFDNRPFETIKGIPDAVSDILFFGQCKKKIKKINEFRKNYISYTPKCYMNSQEMAELNNDFDIFVAGSDQIWNVHKGIVDEFFLSFVNEDKKKISYSASFGLSVLPPEYITGVQQGLARFDRISIRETSGVKIAKELTGNEYPQTLDPVFLIEKENWDELCGERMVKEKYIFVYPTQITKILTETVRKAKKETGCRVYSLFYFNGVDKVVKDADPIDFLNYIKYADTVIGSSFHATAFALIFEKNLKVIPHSTTGSRVIDLLTNLGLEKQCVVHDTDNISFSETDYTEAREIMKQEIYRSKEYLISGLAMEK